MNEKQHLLNICTLNTRGLKNNQIYYNDLSQKCNILCIQDSWHLSLEEINKYYSVPGKKIFHKLAYKNNNRGRASSGLIFIVDDDLLASEPYPSKRIGVLKINKLAMVQVYLPFFENNDAAKLEFKIETATLEQTIAELEKSGHEIIVIGDFNCNFDEQNANTKEMKRLLKANNMTPLDLTLTQDYGYTHYQVRKGELIVSWPDHVCASKQNKNVKKVELLSMNNNLSDHRAIMTEYVLIEDPSFNESKHNRKIKLNLNWADLLRQKKFSIQCEQDLEHLERELVLLDRCSPLKKEEKLRSIMNEIASILKLNGKVFLDKTKQPHKNSKYWWSPTMQKYHNEVSEAWRLCQPFQSNKLLTM